MAIERVVSSVVPDDSGKEEAFEQSLRPKNFNE